MSEEQKNNQKKDGKKRRYIGLYIMFGVAIIMILYYLIFINGIISS